MAQEKSTTNMLGFQHRDIPQRRCAISLLIHTTMKGSTIAADLIQRPGQFLFLLTFLLLGRFCLQLLAEFLSPLGRCTKRRWPRLQFGSISQPSTKRKKQEHKKKKSCFMFLLLGRLR